ncbi:MAG: hypothetical protein QF569_23570 [Candidatus Poribacteria bacterium]|nr:hypothetical protein [Candidatus Poribacteria bacterium]
MIVELKSQRYHIRIHRPFDGPRDILPGIDSHDYDALLSWCEEYNNQPQRDDDGRHSEVVAYKGGSNG